MEEIITFVEFGPCWQLKKSRLVVTVIERGVKPVTVLKNLVLWNLVLIIYRNINKYAYE